MKIKFLSIVLSVFFFNSCISTKVSSKNNYDYSILKPNSKYIVETKDGNKIRQFEYLNEKENLIIGKQEGKEIQIVDDQWRTPTLAEDLAMGCYLIAKKEATGIFNISGKEIQAIVTTLCNKKFQVTGKSTFKDEFVTAGGIDLKEINFKNMSSKILPNFYIAGEVLNIDAVTGGFNFQACWSESWLIAQDLNGL